MNGPDHRYSGVVTGLAVIFCARALIPMPLPLAAGFLTYAGATAPDWMERPLGIRLIPHRTITHWWAIYAGAMCGAFFYFEIAQSVLIASFCIGALVHISGDALTPMGVPALTPFTRRKLSLKATASTVRTLWMLGITLVSGGVVAITA